MLEWHDGEKCLIKRKLQFWSQHKDWVVWHPQMTRMKINAQSSCSLDTLYPAYCLTCLEWGSMGRNSVLVCNYRSLKTCMIYRAKLWSLSQTILWFLFLSASLCHFEKCSMYVRWSYFWNKDRAGINTCFFVPLFSLVIVKSSHAADSNICVANADCVIRAFNFVYEKWEWVFILFVVVLCK